MITYYDDRMRTHTLLYVMKAWEFEWAVWNIIRTISFCVRQTDEWARFLKRNTIHNNRASASGHHRHGHCPHLKCGLLAERVRGCDVLNGILIALLSVCRRIIMACIFVWCVHRVSSCGRDPISALRMGRTTFEMCWMLRLCFGDPTICEFLE